ncbi:unnamed protein product [Rotaria sordida]|uniref:Uncharacterized protein n=1 Tax=Rotaria sordida TaxID=392033 RepID=A0A818QX77_9BILA|nr:unnamed protein product [Rotaria sordida]CAF3648280.1 unnamed protein product [Rotaria sordida]CAF3948121.1 unnamed protein product [Rotaria sordida]
MNIVKITHPFDANQLPKYALSFTDEKFYGFVKELLELDIDSKELDDLRQKVSFSCRDGTYRVKAGIKNDSKYLKKLLLSKLEENGKIKPRSRQTTTKVYPASSILAQENHAEFIYNLIKKWVQDNKENFNFDELELKPDIDYTLTITDNNNVVEGVIRCKCDVKINNNDVGSNNNNQTSVPSSATPQQSLSQISINAPTSSLYRASISSSSTTKGTKRISSSLIPTYSQQSSSSAKRHKK